MSNVEDKLSSIFIDLLPNESDRIQDCVRGNSVDWDSMVQLRLIVSIEEEFNVTLSDEDAVDITSFKMALAVLKDIGIDDA